MTLRLFETELEDHHLNPLDAQTLTETREILSGIRRFGSQAIILHASRVGDITADDPTYCFPRQSLHKAFKEISVNERKQLVSIVKSVYNYYTTKYSIGTNNPRAKTVGCFVPVNLQQDLKSIILKVLTAKILCVDTVIVCSRKPPKLLLAAAYIAGADHFLLFGGVQAIGALAFGFTTNALELPACNQILGLGNHWVESAKKIVSEEYEVVSVDLIGGPNQILIIFGPTQGQAMLSIVERVVKATQYKDRTVLYVFCEESMVLQLFQTKVEEFLTHILDSMHRDSLKHIINSSYGKVFDNFDKLIETVLKFCPERYFVFADPLYEIKVRQALAKHDYIGGYMNLIKR